MSVHTKRYLHTYIQTYIYTHTHSCLSSQTEWQKRANCRRGHREVKSSACSVSAEQVGTRNRNTIASVDHSWMLQNLLYLFSCLQDMDEVCHMSLQTCIPIFSIYRKWSTNMERWEYKECWCRPAPPIFLIWNWLGIHTNQGPNKPAEVSQFPFLEFSPSLQSLPHLVLEDLLMPLLLYRLKLWDISDGERQGIS